MIAILQAPIVLAAPVTTPQAAILAELADSADGWNRGDLARFMAIYAPDATFVTRRGLVRGKAAIADRYRKSFTAGGNRRGTLSFDDTAFRRIDSTHLLLWGRWTLKGAKIETGRTTLLFQRRPEGWRIVSDHSS